MTLTEKTNTEYEIKDLKMKRISTNRIKQEIKIKILTTTKQ